MTDKADTSSSFSLSSSLSPSSPSLSSSSPSPSSGPSLLSSFRYRTVFEKGRPMHGEFDSFYIKHPPMELSKRAKIFNPFDALKGFSEAISSKEAETVADTDTDPDAAPGGEDY